MDSTTTNNGDKIVLRTGINGYIASHIASFALVHGFRVRGTARSVAKAQNIKTALEKLHAAEGRVEIVEVPDICAEGAFGEAVKGVYAIIHTASILSFSSNPQELISPVLASLHSLLESAAKSPSSSVKHFIYTSSSTAAIRAQPNVPARTTSSTWNELDLKEVWGPKADGWIVYGASKAAGERALWSWVSEHEKEQKWAFSVNAILPASCFGPVICAKEVSSSGAMMREVYHNRLANLLGVCPQYFVSVEDAALLHLAPILLPVIDRQRLFAWSAPYNWNDVLKVMREIRPERTFENDIEGLGHDLTTVENGPAEKLLKQDEGGR